MKKYLLTIIPIFLLNSAFAEVIELDASNAKNCIKQISQSKSYTLIILEYSKRAPTYPTF
ncbi:MAG: hypothetical protein ACK5Z5_04945 [Neisseriaceae bacterium]